MIAFVAPTLVAQQIRGNRVLTEIENDYRDGAITIDQKILYSMYAGFKPDRLPAGYGSGSAERTPVKCGLPLLREYIRTRQKLSHSTIRQIESVIRPPHQGEHSYPSPGGLFVVYYDTSGEHAVPTGDDDPEYGGNGIPDYVDWVAAAADSSWQHEVANLGFADPVEDPSNPYPIYIESKGSTYGYTDYSSPSGSTFIGINSQLNDSLFTNNDDDNPTRGAIRVTLAHELKHAIQYANSRWYGWFYNQDGYNYDPSSPHSTDWSETDATLMEEVVYDSVNDYYNYIFADSGYEPVFSTEMHSVPAPYAGVTWAIYFWEKYGDDFWPGVWARIAERFNAEKEKTEPDFLTMVEAISLALEQEYNDSFKIAFAESHLWHYASGAEQAREGYGFDEKFNYPDPLINYRLIARSDNDGNGNVSLMGAHYISAGKAPDLEGFVLVTAEYDQPMAYTFGLIGYFSDGSVDTIIRHGAATGSGAGETRERLTITTTWDWLEIDQVGIVVANPDNDSYSTYKVVITSHIPRELQLAQNYPNPFNPGTVIPFALPQQSHVELAIFDVVGRKIATLRDESLEAGFYEEPFDAGNLASGIYFYRLKTDRKTITKKMTLIK